MSSNTKIPYHGERIGPLWWLIPVAKFMAYASFGFGLSGPVSWYFGWLKPRPDFEHVVPILTILTIALFLCAVGIVISAIIHNARIETNKGKTP